MQPARMGKLRAKMAEYGINQKYLAKKIGRTEPYVSDRMLGRRPFTVDDVYVLCKLLSIPVGEVLEYFPPSIRKGGRSGGQ